ncbi:hypothetical protein V8E36_009035 [Tilletia maclaganii]
MTTGTHSFGRAPRSARFARRKRSSGERVFNSRALTWTINRPATTPRALSLSLALVQQRDAPSFPPNCRLRQRRLKVAPRTSFRPQSLTAGGLRSPFSAARAVSHQHGQPLGFDRDSVAVRHRSSKQLSQLHSLLVEPTSDERFAVGMSSVKDEQSRLLRSWTPGISARHILRPQAQRRMDQGRASKQKAHPDRLAKAVSSSTYIPFAIKHRRINTPLPSNILRRLFVRQQGPKQAYLRKLKLRPFLLSPSASTSNSERNRPPPTFTQEEPQRTSYIPLSTPRSHRPAAPP